jgi:large subunit ribosomal protein L4
MAIQKLVKYDVLNFNTRESSQNHEIKYSVLETTGNYLVHKDILRHQNLNKQGSVSTKTRKEVRGGGRKPWRQKGTGRARAGSNCSPLWKGGGVIFGPKQRVFNYKLNKKERKLALQTLLYNTQKQTIIIDDLEESVTAIKTNEFSKLLKNLNLSLNEKILIVVSKKTDALFLSSKNLKNIELIAASNLNTLSLLKAKRILITLKGLEDIKEIYCD